MAAKRKVIAVKAPNQATKVNLGLLRSEYEGGILTRAQICEKHSINKSTLYRHAVNGDWEFGKNQEKALTTMQTALVRRLGERRATVSDQHLGELNELKALGADQIQGFYFAKPMPCDELLEWLAKQSN